MSEITRGKKCNQCGAPADLVEFTVYHKKGKKPTDSEIATGLFMAEAGLGDGFLCRSCRRKETFWMIAGVAIIIGLLIGTIALFYYVLFKST